MARIYQINIADARNLEFDDRKSIVISRFSAFHDVHRPSVLITKADEYWLGWAYLLTNLEFCEDPTEFETMLVDLCQRLRYMRTASGMEIRVKR